MAAGKFITGWYLISYQPIPYGFIPALGLHYCIALYSGIAIIIYKICRRLKALNSEVLNTKP